MAGLQTLHWSAGYLTSEGKFGTVVMTLATPAFVIVTVALWAWAREEVIRLAGPTAVLLSLTPLDGEVPPPGG